MKIQKDIVYCSLIILLISAWLLSSSIDTNLINLALGIMASSIVLLVSSFVSYLNERKKSIDLIIHDISTMTNKLGTLRTSNSEVDVLFNISLIDNCHQQDLKALTRKCNELSFLFRSKLKTHIFTAILDPLDLIFLKIVTHHGMLKWILLYKESEDMVTAHYLHCLRMNSRESNDKNIFMPIKKYIKISNEDRIKYHNEQLLATFIFPRETKDIKSETIVHALPFIASEITLLLMLSDRIFINKKFIHKMRASHSNIAQLWDNVSNNAHTEMLEAIKKIKGE